MDRGIEIIRQMANTARKQLLWKTALVVTVRLDTEDIEALEKVAAMAQHNHTLDLFISLGPRVRKSLLGEIYEIADEFDDQAYCYGDKTLIRARKRRGRRFRLMADALAAVCRERENR